MSAALPGLVESYDTANSRENNYQPYRPIDLEAKPLSSSSLLVLNDDEDETGRDEDNTHDQ